MQLEAQELADIISAAGSKSKPSGENGKRELGLQIVVADRGFVYVGKTTIDGDFVTIADARNIRKWGTTAGLGQLAKDGPTSDTKLDHAGEVLVPLKAVIHFIKCTRNW